MTVKVFRVFYLILFAAALVTFIILFINKDEYNIKHNEESNAAITTVEVYNILEHVRGECRSKACDIYNIYSYVSTKYNIIDNQSSLTNAIAERKGTRGELNTLLKLLLNAAGVDADTAAYPEYRPDELVLACGIAPSVFYGYMADDVKNVTLLHEKFRISGNTAWVKILDNQYSRRGETIKLDIKSNTAFNFLVYDNITSAGTDSYYKECSAINKDSYLDECFLTRGNAIIISPVDENANIEIEINRGYFNKDDYVSVETDAGSCIPLDISLDGEFILQSAFI